jgi:ClpP class serine protease
VKGRPTLTAERLRSEAVIKKPLAVYDDKGNVVKPAPRDAKGDEFVRYRADGGTFTAAEAKKFELIDEIGLLEDAVAAVASSAGLSEYRVVGYERPPSLLTTLLGVEAPAAGPDLKQISAGLTPRVWYMAPQAEMSGMIAAGAAGR